MAPDVTTYVNGHDESNESQIRSIATPLARETTPIRSLSSAVGVKSSKGPSESRAETIETEDLYHLDFVSAELSTALRLLSRSLGYADEGLRAEREGDAVDADDAMQQLQGVLPELFCCRTLSDGFGIAINSIMCAFHNLQGTPLSRPQMEAIRRVLAKVRSQPVLSTDGAVDLLDELEQVNLVIEPPEYDALADLLSE